MHSIPLSPHKEVDHLAIGQLRLCRHREGHHYTEVPRDEKTMTRAGPGTL